MFQGHSLYAVPASCLLTAVAGVAAAQGHPQVWCQLLRLCEEASKQQGEEAA